MISGTAQVNFFFGKNLAHTFSSSVFKLIMLLSAYKVQQIFTQPMYVYTYH